MIDSRTLLTPQFEIRNGAEVSHVLGQHPGITRLSNDDLLLVYGDYTDGMAGQTGYVIRSRDQGATWSEPELILSARWHNGGTHTSLGMTTLSTGRVLLPWVHGGDAKTDTFCATRFICLRSDDHGNTWKGWDEQAIDINHIVPYGKIIELPNGTLLCPVWEKYLKNNTHMFRSGLLRSYDQGVTWGDGSILCDGRDSNETDLTQLADGRLLALIRMHPPEGPVGDKRLFWTYYSHSSDGGKTWTSPKSTDVLSHNFNAWITPAGTLIGACRGIDGTGRLRQHEIEDDDEPLTDQRGYGIHFFVADKPDGSQWAYQFTLPDPEGYAYTAYHESGEPCFCTLANGDTLVAYYSHKESILDTLKNKLMPPATQRQKDRIPHCFMRRICTCVLHQNI